MITTITFSLLLGVAAAPSDAPATARATAPATARATALAERLADPSAAHRVPRATTPAFLLPWFDASASAELSLVLGLAAPPMHDDECAQVAALALQGAFVEARADFLLALANCINEGGSLGRCLRDLRGDYDDARSLAREQSRARLRLCELTGGGRYDPEIDPDDFDADIDNRYLPLVPGRTRVYRKTDDEGTEVVTVTTLAETVEIAGVECRVVRDVVRLDDELIEDTDDWYAQDECGNVWYFGEIARNYEDGMLTDLGGSWRAGVDGAKPGILMKARPRVGDVYRQEFLLGVAEDAAIVVATDVTVTVPAGRFTGCVQTEDFTPLEPGHREHKFYAPGVGVVLEVSLATGARLELVRIGDR